jgi:DNA-binding GntR family transcriptional regulator
MSPPAPSRGAPEAPRPLPLKERAYTELLELLLSGELPAGTFVSERQLAARLGMSKTPIRVALERLDRDGFVEILPQRGVRLRELSEAEAVDHYDLRIALESWVIRRVAERATARDIRALERIVERQRKLLGPRRRVDRVAVYLELDAAFHFTLAEIAGNAEILRAMRTQRDRLARVVSTLLDREPGWILTTAGEHEAIVAALRRGDADAAEREMVAHLERGKELLRRALVGHGQSDGRVPGDVALADAGREPAGEGALAEARRQPAGGASGHR